MLKDLWHRPWARMIWIERSLEAISRCLIAKDGIAWPDDTERRDIAREFGRKSPFHNCVGLLDGTFIQMEHIPGRENNRLWSGSRDTYGYNVLVVVDHEYRIRSLHTVFLASHHDEQVYRSTKVTSPPTNISFNDSAYTPNVNSAQEDEKHSEFNADVKKAHVVMERAMGYWKAQVKNPEKYVTFATALLHNYVLEHEGLDDDELIDEAELELVKKEDIAAQKRLVDIQELNEAEKKGDGSRREAVRAEVERMRELGRSWGRMLRTE
ncbi:hypothetical protein L198_06587 [Cryptococcus wingfieldii CBS 7118]|uniref:DDE Tnp4 domain-containing protein n=1 Tax=Cryptococcus wingfieldii CBS 7118 TaxID=1295528 RepID=A0A1E3IK25_9TREE|nr:hypothetical protein L198_06587 [Cryptococcus wingfieldii CBS 7118]ODN88785.1 hypothetical protein L198_06587 [Cryptococcus wingfieldii CBS 7118]